MPTLSPLQAAFVLVIVIHTFVAKISQVDLRTAFGAQSLVTVIRLIKSSATMATQQRIMIVIHAKIISQTIVQKTFLNGSTVQTQVEHGNKV